MNIVRLKTSPWRLAKLALAAVFAVLVGCTDTPGEPNGQGNLRAVHAIAEYGTVQFLIEGASLVALEFQGTSSFSEFDDLNYDFNFEVIDGSTGELARVATTNLTVEVDTDYTFFVTGSPASPQITIVSQPESTLDANATDVELWFANLSSVPGGIDFYVGATDFDPAATQPLASLAATAFNDDIASLAADTYQVVVTARGDAATEIYRSEPFGFPSGDRFLVNFFDNAGDGTTDYTLQIAGGSTAGSIADDAAPTRLQIFHASQTTANVDVLVDADAANPLITNLAFGELSDLSDVAAADDGAEVALQVTPTGDAGVTLLEQAATFADATSSFAVLSGDQADETLAIIPIALLRRPVFDAVRFGVFNAVQTQDFIDLYLLEEGEELETENPLARLPGSTAIDQLTLTPINYQVYITEQDTKTVLAGPLDLALAAGEVVELIIVDSAIANTVDIVVLDPR
ncbi:MAG: DUF4397 domain-containing protein [Pseudomonadota bacterium]